MSSLLPLLSTSADLNTAPSLRALSHSLEQLLSDLERLVPAQESTRRPLQRVRRLGADLGDLIDYAHAAPIAPRACRLEEIAFAACLPLPRQLRSRVCVARESVTTSVHVDGPLVARCGARLLINCFEAGATSVQLFVRLEGSSLLFGVLDRGARAPFDPSRALRPFFSQKPMHLGLGLVLVRRDAERMGGRLALEVSTEGLCARLDLPLPQSVADARPGA